MIDYEHKPATAETYPSRWRIGAAAVTALAATATLSACLSAKGGTSPIPGERLGVVRITTIPSGLTVRLISQVVAGPPALVQKVTSPEKTGPSPLEVSVSYQPGFGTRMVVHGFLKDPLKPGGSVTLGCDVLADGQPVQGAEDVNEIREDNQQTGFVLCTFDEGLAPPLPGNK